MPGPASTATTIGLGGGNNNTGGGNGGPRTPRPLKMSMAMMKMPPPPFPPSGSASGAPAPVFNLGDIVKLPEGQQGILKYIGQISGKAGEFAGVELIDEWASQGRHNGEFNGYVFYFNFLSPCMGLFIRAVTFEKKRHDD